jgi:hypothetical protein
VTNFKLPIESQGIIILFVARPVLKGTERLIKRIKNQFIGTDSEPLKAL